MKDVAQIITAMRRYVDGHVNETVERQNFRRRVQQPGESFNDFLISLHANSAQRPACKKH